MVRIRVIDFIKLMMNKISGLPSIYGEDLFFIRGLRAILLSIRKELTACRRATDSDDDNLPDIWILSREGTEEIYKFVDIVDRRRPCIVFGNECHKRILYRIPGLDKVVFIEHQITVPSVRKKIKSIMAMNFQKRAELHDLYCRYLALSEYEDEVLKSFMSGKTLTAIAIKSRRPVKSVSACKRRIMKKYNVFNNQELHARAWAMGYRPLAINSV